MKRRFSVLIAVLAVVLCICIAVFLLWKPVMTAVAPEVVLASAVANTVSQTVRRLDSPLADCLADVLSYIRGGSADVELTLDNLLLDSSYRLTTRSDPENQQQASSFQISMLGISTDISTYLDADCAAVSSGLLGNSSYYGICFDTYPADLKKSRMYDSLNPETIQALNTFVEQLESIYNPEEARTATPELPEMAAPDWVRTLMAYVQDLDFSASEVLVELDGADRECIAVSTTMNSRYAAGMFLDALRTVSSNFWLASSLYSEDSSETSSIQEKLEYYRDRTDGTVTLTAIIYEDTVATVDLEWQFTENYGDMDINDTEVLTLCLGITPAENPWSLTVQHEKDGNITTSAYSIDLSGNRWCIGQTRTERGMTTDAELLLQWDSESGLLEVGLTKDGTEAIATGELHHSDGSVTLELRGLNGFFKLIDLPEVLSDANLTLVRDITLEAAFSADKSITKPEYINLDQWELPLLLDLIL